MAAPNIASTGIVLEVLTKDNYLDWSVLVKNYLIGKELWYNIVEGKLDRENSNWESKNGLALHAIQLSCGHHTLSQIRNFETAHEAWNQLKDIFSEDSKAADHHDIEQGCLQTDIDMFHMAIKKNLWEEANEYITRHAEEDIISQKSSSSSKGWTSLHVAVDAVQYEIMKKLVEMGASMTEKDSKGYTPFALAAESPGGINIEFVRWMLNEGGGGNELLTMKINSDDDKGDIPVLLAAIKGHQEMTRYLFSETPSSTLLDDNCYYGAKLLSHCIHAEIWDVAAKLVQLQQDDGTQIPLSYEFDQCMRPIHALAHIPTAFVHGTRLGFFERKIYTVLQILPLDHEGKVIANDFEPFFKLSDFPTAFIIFTTGLIHIFTGYNIMRLCQLKKDHYLVREILRCFCERIEKISLESELHKWSVHDAMLQAVKYGNKEFINSMRKANPDLLWVMDKYKRGIFAHAILNRQEIVFTLMIETLQRGQARFLESIDIFGNNLLHLAAELGPSSDNYHRHEFNACFQMQREIFWFEAVEKFVPLLYKKAKNADGLKPRELFTKNHEKLLNEARQWVKETANSFTIVGTLIMTIMFAAAFTVPGGNDQNKGIPIFLGQNAFSVFIIADVLSLVTSSSAVLIFIGILTSCYPEEEFRKTLPKTLLTGIYTIFISLACMMCAVCAALSLMLKGYNSIMVTSIAVLTLPILLFSYTTSRRFKVLTLHYNISRKLFQFYETNR